MASVTPYEIGLVVWAEESAEATLTFLKGFGLEAGQLGVPPAVDCSKALASWKASLPGSGVVMTSAVCAYEGEDYADMARVHESVGFTTPKYREARIARTKDVAAFADALGIKALSCHIGFIPPDASEALYGELVDVTRTLCDACAQFGQDFVLETGQESAEVLLGFLAAVERGNLKVNFDPANMILYGSGDPIKALEMLQAHVTSIHCKDGTSPVAGSGLLGSECVLGAGEVDFPAFLRQLKAMRYDGLLTIEREEPNAGQKAADVRTAIDRLTEWKAAAGL